MGFFLNLAVRKGIALFTHAELNTVVGFNLVVAKGESQIFCTIINPWRARTRVMVAVLSQCTLVQSKLL